MYHLSIRTLVIRLFLIMAIIVAAGFSAYYFGSAFWFLTILAFPIFLSCILGIEFERHPHHDRFDVKHHEDSAADYRRLAH
jgi:uncharacterized protein (DUF58 family)